MATGTPARPDATSTIDRTWPQSAPECQIYAPHLAVSSEAVTVQNGGYLRVPDRCRGYGVQPDVDAAIWPQALGTARRWPVRPRAGASCTETAPPRRRWLACRARSTSPRPDGRWHNATTPRVAFRLNPAPDGRRRLLLPTGRLRVGIRFLHQDDLAQRATMLVMRALEHRRRRTR